MRLKPYFPVSKEKPDDLHFFPFEMKRKRITESVFRTTECMMPKMADFLFVMRFPPFSFFLNCRKKRQMSETVIRIRKNGEILFTWQ